MINYKNLIIFQRCHQFTIELNKIIKTFPENEKFGFSYIIKKTSSSIGLNLVKGSNRENKSEIKIYFLLSADKAKEMEYYLLLIKDLNYINQDTYDKLKDCLDHIIGGIINYCKKFN